MDEIIGIKGISYEMFRQYSDSSYFLVLLVPRRILHMITVALLYYLSNKY